MLETFVSSKIKRSVLEYLLAHPDGRFYLRGLAKDLGLAVSPVHRELKRLSSLGILKDYREGNIRFYLVDPTSPQFAKLQSVFTSVGGQTPPVVLSHAKVERIRRALSPPLSKVMAISAAALGIVVVGVLGITVSHLVATQQRLVWLTHQAVTTPRSQVTVVESVRPRPAGEMISSLWRVVPGTMGGFSAGSTEGTY